MVSLSLAIPIILFSDLILELWMGNNFSNENKILLIMLAGSYLLLSINVVPHFLNLVSGNAKFTSLLNMFGGIISILTAVWLIDEYGFIGLMFGKLTYGLILTIGNIGLGQKKI